MDKIQKVKNDMIFKWASVPFAILCVLVGGASYNLFAYFTQIGALQGYGPTTMTIIKYVVLFGYYLGLIPGQIVKTMGPMITLIIAGVMSIISWSVLGWITNSGEGSTLNWCLMMFFLFTGAISGSFATMASFVSIVKTFPDSAATLLVVILMADYKIAPYLEYSIRAGFLSDPDLMWYFISVGAVMCLIFVISAFVVRIIDIDLAIERIMEKYDVAGLLIFVLFEALMLALFYVIALIYEDWFVGAIIFVSFIALNFLLVGIAFKVVYDQLKKSSAKDFMKSSQGEKRKQVEFSDMLGKGKFHCLVFASMCIIGLGATFTFNIFQIAFAYGEADSGDHLLDTIWAADMLGRFGCGLLAYFLYESANVNNYHFAIFGSATVAIGFGIVLLTEALGGIALFTGSILIGFGSGTMWVIVPCILIDDAGELNFGLNWGYSLFWNAFGMLVFGETFDWIYEWQAGGSDQCTGGACVLIQFIFFGLIALTGVALSWYALQTDEKVGQKKPAKGEKERKSKGDKKDRGRSKSKDKKEKSSKDKSSKDKSAKKSSSKSKDKSRKRDSSKGRSKAKA